MSYSNFKTPYFEIFIGKGKSAVPLPTQLMRLVEKIEITETLGQECVSNLVFTIIFREGSREPFPHFGTIPDSIYGSEDVLSNATGMLQDLILKGSNSNPNGFKFITSGGGKDTSLEAFGAGLATQEVGVSLSANFDEKINISNNLKTIDQPYVFSSGNTISITWGYKESDLKTAHRTVTGKIIIVQSSFPEIGHPTLTVVCNGSDRILEQYSPVIGKVFKKKNINGDFQGESVHDILEKIGQAFSIEFKISENLIYASQGKGVADVWPAGKTLVEFLKEIARRNFAYLDIRINPETGNPLVHIFNRKDYDTESIIEDINLFNYKQPGSILKTVEIKADYTNPSGSAQGTVTDSGKVTKTGSSKSVQLVAVPEGTQLMNFVDDIGSNILNGMPTKTPVNSVEVTPPMSEETMKARTDARTGCMDKGIITMDFTCLGLPALRPIVVWFGGLGKRYSGPYRVISVVHTIDGNGYTCRGTGNTNVDYGITKGTSSGSPEIKPPQVEKQLMTPIVPADVGKVVPANPSGTDSTVKSYISAGLNYLGF